MNISTRLQRTSLIGIAAITLAGSGLFASSASAKTDSIGGGDALTHRSTPAAPEFARPQRTFDEAAYVTSRKIAEARDRIDRAWLYR